MAAVVVMQCSNPVCMLIESCLGGNFRVLSKNLLGSGYRKQTTFLGLMQLIPLSEHNFQIFQQEQHWQKTR